MLLSMSRLMEPLLLASALFITDLWRGEVAGEEVVLTSRLRWSLPTKEWLLKCRFFFSGGGRGGVVVEGRKTGEDLGEGEG